MNNNYNPNFQYNSCISKGICSVNPRTSALQNVLVLYLNVCAKYCLKLYDKKALKDSVKDFILNTLAICILNPEFTEDGFNFAISKIKTLLPELINKYKELFPDDKNETKESELLKNCDNIIDSIKFGEEISRKASEIFTTQLRDLYKIMLICAKSLCINILDFESYKETSNKGFLEILNILKHISLEKQEIDILKKAIKNCVNCDLKIRTKLRKIQESRYGTQNYANVSYTTTPSKAILVVGSNIKELENILESLRETKIDVYTHDEMILAHTFPKFKEYKNLKGQFGHGLENCLIDFATFPGPIILTKHSLHNIENFYRGRLFTTEQNSYKGVVSICNNDFSKVIESANQSKGFKTGKNCDTVKIGYDFDQIKNIISKKIIEHGYKKFVLIGLKEYYTEQKDYFEKLIKLIPDDTLIISFSYNKKQENLIHINACFDSYALIRIFKYIYDYNLPVDIFMPKCDRNTISEMIYLKEFDNTQIFVGDCIPIMINPSLRKTLHEVFDIKTITSPKQDLAE